MEPTDALFDAINRGDIACGARCDQPWCRLDGRNVLGMTPMELSVDLGRNDISFMLLSMRGGTTKARPRRRPPSRQAKAARGDHSKPRRRGPTAGATSGKGPPPPAPSQTARLFSGDGGAPNPNAGFLGFDAGRR